LAALCAAGPEVCRLQNNEGDTPLHIAAKARRPQHVHIICGCDPQATLLSNALGENPLLAMLRHINLSPAPCSDDDTPAVMEHLVTAAPQCAMAKSSEGGTVLHALALCCINSRVGTSHALASLLLEHCPGLLDECDANGDTAASLLVKHSKGHPREEAIAGMLQALLVAGAAWEEGWETGEAGELTSRILQATSTGCGILQSTGWLGDLHGSRNEESGIGGPGDLDEPRGVLLQLYGFLALHLPLQACIKCTGVSSDWYTMAWTTLSQRLPLTLVGIVAEAAQANQLTFNHHE